MSRWDVMKKGDIILKVNTLLKQSKQNVLDIKKDPSSVKLKNLINDTFKLKSLLSYIQLMTIIDLNNPIWENGLNILNKYLVSLKLDNELYNIFIKLDLLKLDNLDKEYVTDMIRLYKEVGHASDKDKDVILQLYNYKQDLEKTLNTDIEIENLIKLILCKNTYAKKLKYTNYYNYIDNLNDEKIPKITSFITNLYDNINQTNNTKKKLKKYIPRKIIIEIFKLISKNFGLEFKLTPDLDETGWNEDVLIIDIYDDDTIIGYLYLDLLQDNYLCSEPVYIQLVERSYLNNTGIYVIIANYENIDKHTMLYDDVLNLFRLFGDIICDIYYKCNKKYSNVVSNIMEFLCLEYINYLVDSKSYKQNMYHQCIDSIFDLKINTDPEFIKLCKLELNNKNNKNILLDVYKNIKNTLFVAQSLPKKTIYNIVNTNYPLYNNILNKIYAFNIYNSSNILLFKEKVLDFKGEFLNQLVNTFGTDIIDNYSDYLLFLEKL